jgi:hypothetical protein
MAEPPHVKIWGNIFRAHDSHGSRVQPSDLVSAVACRNVTVAAAEANRKKMSVRGSWWCRLKMLIWEWWEVEAPQMCDWCIMCRSRDVGETAGTARREDDNEYDFSEIIHVKH